MVLRPSYHDDVPDETCKNIDGPPQHWLTIEVSVHLVEATEPGP